MNCDRMLDEVRKLGMDPKWSRMFVKKLSDDEQAFRMTEEQKKWAMERGFFPGRIALYGVNEENYRDYVPDYYYFMLHPMNHHFRIWVNDKLSLKYVLNSSECRDVMPEYYLYVENDGSYTYLMDCPQDIERDRDFLFHLLLRKRILAMKPNSGTSGGLGFIKLEISEDGQLSENNHPIDMSRFAEIQSSMRNYIVTEYVYQHADLAKIWRDSECTLRVIMCRDVKADPCAPAHWSCVASFARFGSSLSGGASNLSSGGVGVGFDYLSGQYNDTGVRYRRFCPDGNWRLAAHPDTHVVWASERVPHWPEVREKIEQICQYISSLSYLGFDVIVTDEGMKLCEINTHPALDYAQVMCGPALTRDKPREFFIGKGLYRFDGRQFYQAYLNSKD